MTPNVRREGRHDRLRECPRIRRSAYEVGATQPSSFVSPPACIGLWLMYLTFATTLDVALHYAPPGG
ncbi:hypothetical protein ACQPZQ_15780 [Pseudonocardia sp. CA-142604]|uniref:hypothetical protein n=1 Tax=Pseudonocardia sp. CA-142604 TaxID=3240024 RepID=UPI003D8A6A3A